MSAATNHTPEVGDRREADLEFQLGQILTECNDALNLGEFEGALECLHRAVNLAPANPDILSHRAQLLWFLKKFDPARMDFAEAVRINPGHITGNAGLARSYLQTGNHAQAEICARRALAHAPENQEAGEVLSALEKIAAANSAQARQSIADYFANAREEFAAVEPPALSEWHLKHSRILPNRESILELMPRGGICAEIGTQTGDFAKRILAHLKPAQLHIFDLDFTPFDRPAFEPLIQDGSVVLHGGDSSPALAQLPDHSFDFIYIDGDHSYEGVTRDLAAAAQKIKADGWIVCNDYTIYSPVEQMQYGVYRAVNEFCWQQGFEIVYLGLHYWSYHDVALRRMKPESVALAGAPPAPSRATRPVTHQPSAWTAPSHARSAPMAGSPRVLTTGETLNTVTNGGTPSPAASAPKPVSITETSLPYELDPGLSLVIGEHSYLHDHTIRNPSGALTKVTVGKFCCIATGLSVIGYDHHSEWAAMYPFLDDGHRAHWPGTHGIPYPQSPEFGSNKSRGDIAIGNDVWIGSDVKLFKGVTIGDGAVIGACSLVNKSVEPYTIVAGIPARPIRKRFSDEEIKLLQQVKWWDLPASVLNRHMALLCSSRIAELASALAADPEFQHLPPRAVVTATSARCEPQSGADMTPAPTEVSETIGAGDEMFTGDRAHYFGVGKSAMHAIETALAAARLPRNHIRKILDLPCGHGRVMRHFRAAFPHAQITACDLNRGAVDFCAQTFAAQPFYSNVDVSRIALPGGYDLIWSGSLLTHLRAGGCAEFVRLFNSLVNPGGLIVFTLHGRWVERSLASRRYTYGLREPDVVAILKEYEATGFGYADYPGVAGYGISLSSPAFVLAQLVALPDLKLVGYHEKGWDNHQDVVCLQKQPASEPLG